MPVSPKAISEFLKTNYPKANSLESIAFERPLLNLLPKNHNSDGEPRLVVLQHGTAAGRSRDFAAARAQVGRDAGVAKLAFYMDDDYATVSISEREMASNQGAGSFAKSLKTRVENAVRDISDSLVTRIYGQAGGAVAKVKSGQGTKTLVLENPSDARRFRVGDVLDGGTTNGSSGTAIVGGAEAVVASIDYEAGSITKEGANNWNNSAALNGIAAGNFLFKKGDFGAKLTGLGGWLPSTAPSPGDSFGGFDRSINSALSGHRVSAQATIAQTITRADKSVFNFGGRPSVCMVSPDVYERLITELGAKVMYNSVKGEAAKVGFKGIEIIGQSGNITVLADPFCPELTGFLLDLSTWELGSWGHVPGWLGRSGLPGGAATGESGAPLIVETGSSAVSVRMAYFAQLFCDAPWKNARIAFAPAT